jgi:hypothetical protein
LKRLASAAQLRPWPIHIFNQLGEILKPPSTANKLSIAGGNNHSAKDAWVFCGDAMDNNDRKARSSGKELEDRTFLNPGNCDYAGLA